MLPVILVGIFFILLSGIVNILESMKFFKALGILNNHTKTFMDRILYPFRLICLLPMLWRIIPDICFMAVAGTVGLGGGVMGSIIAIGGTCALTLLLKLVLRITNSNNSDMSYSQSISQLA